MYNFICQNDNNGKRIKLRLLKDNKDENLEHIQKS